MENELLNLSEVMKILSVSRQKIYMMANNNEIPIIRIGRNIKVPKRALEQWIENNTKKAAVVNS